VSPRLLVSSLLDVVSADVLPVHLVPGGSWWFPVVPGGSRRFLVVPGGSRCLHTASLRIMCHDNQDSKGKRSDQIISEQTEPEAVLSALRWEINVWL